MQNKDEPFSFFSRSPKSITVSTPIKIRFFAQYSIYKNYGPHVESWLKKFGCLDILPSIQVSSRFTFKADTTQSSDIALIIMRELEATRETQLSWYTRMTDIIRSKATRCLIITFSDLADEIKSRKALYEQSIPNISVEYFNFEDWLPDHIEDISPILDCIENYISQFKEIDNTNSINLDLI